MWYSSHKPPVDSFPWCYIGDLAWLKWLTTGSSFKASDVGYLVVETAGSGLGNKLITYILQIHLQEDGRQCGMSSRHEARVLQRQGLKSTAISQVSAVGQGDAWKSRDLWMQQEVQNGRKTLRVPADMGGSSGSLQSVPWSSLKLALALHSPLKEEIRALQQWVNRLQTGQTTRSPHPPRNSSQIPVLGALWSTGSSRGGKIWKYDGYLKIKDHPTKEWMG